MIAPLTIVDKSFIDLLNPQEIEEFSLYFWPVCLAPLVSEIIADLKHPKPRNERTPTDLVQILAKKMSEAHGPQPDSLENLVFGSLMGKRIPMTGQVPINRSAPHVHVNKTGKGILYDQVPQQEMWARWAAGDFTVDDETAAVVWRAGLLDPDLEALGKEWRPFAENLGNPRSLSEIVDAIDDFLNSPKIADQREVARAALTAIRADSRKRNAAYNTLIDAGKNARVRDYAPYAASVARLYLTFAVGLARGAVGPRQSHQADLQYLFYAPFCAVFISNDRLHRDLWYAGAVTSNATFVLGTDLKSDLKRSHAKRAQMTHEEWTAHRRRYGMFPEPVEGSIMAEVWAKHMDPIAAGPQDLGKDDPELIERLLKMRSSFDVGRE